MHNLSEDNPVKNAYRASAHALIYPYLPPFWPERIILPFLLIPAISLLEPVEELILSPSIFTINGGVHGLQAIVFLSPYIPTVDGGTLHG